MSTLAELVEKWCGDPPLSRGADEGTLVLETDGGQVLVEAHDVGGDVAEFSAGWQAPDWLISRTVDALPSLEELAMDTQQARSGMLQAQGGSGAIQLTMRVYLEGLSRQSFMLAVSELGRAYSSLERFAAQVEGRLPELIASDREFAEALAAAEQAQKDAADSEAASLLPPLQEVDPTQAEQPASESAQMVVTVCRSCGAGLLDGAQFCTSCGTPVEAVGQACRNCGTALADGAKFCISCGTRAS